MIFCNSESIGIPQYCEQETQDAIKMRLEGNHLAMTAQPRWNGLGTRTVTSTTVTWMQKDLYTNAGNILVKVHTVKASSACTREAARTDGVRKITKKFKEEIYSS